MEKQGKSRVNVEKNQIKREMMGESRAKTE